MKKIIRTALRKTLLPVLRVKASYSAQSLEKLKHGPAIVCANHVSLLDGVIVALASPVPLTFGVDTDYSKRSKVAMRGMAPPDQHIGLFQPPRRQAVVGLVQRGSGGGDAPCRVQRIGDALVHPLRVKAADDFAFAFMDVLAPDGDADIGHGPIPLAAARGG